MSKHTGIGTGQDLFQPFLPDRVANNGGGAHKQPTGHKTGVGESNVNTVRNTKAEEYILSEVLKHMDQEF